jgi:hypothetical protein
MKMRCFKHLLLLILIGFVMAISFSPGVASANGPMLVVIPDQTVLSPHLIQKPIEITGSGWKVNEPIVVNMKIPQGVTMKGVAPGEDVGIASGTADDKGMLKAQVDAMTILMTFFQVDWDNIKMKPDFSKATPLPPGTYTLEAIGFDSEKKATATLTLLAPPKKEK